MQGFPRASLEKSFLEAKIRAYLALLTCRLACGVFRDPQRGNTITEALGKLCNIQMRSFMPKSASVRTSGSPVAER